MRPIRMSGTLSIDVTGVLMELSPVPKKDMVELTKEEGQDKWRTKKFDRILKECGGRVFYRLHPETIDFLKCFWQGRTYQRDKDYLNLCTWLGERVDLVDLIMDREWKRVDGSNNLTFSNYFDNEGGWAIIGSVPPTSELLPVVMTHHFRKFETNVLGLPDTKVREIAKAMADEHYIHFSMRDRLGKFNSLMALIPLIVETIKKPRFPTPEIQELCDSES